MASAELSRRVEKVVDYPPLSELSDLQRREFHQDVWAASQRVELPASYGGLFTPFRHGHPDRGTAGVHRAS